MKLIQQTKLFFKAGASDKVYEIDLCKLSKSEYLVNFRYGRRGSTLKEGTKTPAAVSQIEAERIFSELENEKRKKGYQTEIETFIELPSLHTIDPDTREGVILQRLQDAIEGKNSFQTEWKTSCVISKAGDIKLKEAIPFIIKLISKGDTFQIYASLRALIQLKADQAESIFQLFAFQPKQKAYIRHMAIEGLLSILTGDELSKCIKLLLEKLPEDVQQDIYRNDMEALAKDLKNHSGKQFVDFFTNLYLISKKYPQVLNSIHSVIKEWKYEQPYFRQVRAIYRLAEVRKDFRTLAIIAYRMEKYPGVFRKINPWDKKEPDFAFSLRTKRYFQKNALSILQDTGKNSGAKEYLQLAVALLLEYSEQDYTPRKETPTTEYPMLDYYGSRRRYFILIDRPECYTSVLLSTILFGNEPERKLAPDMKYRYGQREFYTNNYYYDPQEVYEPQENRRSTESAGQRDSGPSLFGFIKKIFGKDKTQHVTPPPPPPPPIPTATVVDPEPEVKKESRRDIKPLPRYELFPEHWNTMPEAYIQLLLQAQMNIIHRFAYNNLKLRSDFEELCARFQEKELLLLLNSDFRYPQYLGFETLQKRKVLLAKNISFISEVLNSQTGEARKWAREIIDTQSVYYMDNPEFITGLLFNVHTDNRDWIDNQLKNSRFSQERQDALLGKVVTTLLQLEESEANNKLAQTAIERIKLIVGSQLNRVSWDMVELLLSSPLTGNILLASHITLEKSARTSSGDIPTSLIELFLRNSIPDVRKNGIELLARYPDHSLSSKGDFLLGLIENPWQEVMESILERIKKMVVYNSSLRNTTTRHLVYVLMRKETFEGSHTIIRNFLLNELKSYWNSAITPKDLTKLIHASYRQSQLTGYEILTHYNRTQDFTLGQIISFGNHELLAIRQWCWGYFEKNVTRIRYEKLKAFGLLDSKWEDTRTYAFQFFQTQFTENDWDVESLIFITDSIRPDVEGFGKELISRYFKPEYATEYLSKLSEHPSLRIQELISVYLAQHASGKTEIIKELDFYFRSVLTRVHKARVAKKRVFKFLHEEALKNAEVAETIVPVLDYVSAQSTIQDKETSIQILKEIKELYPHLDMHLTLKN